MEILESKQGNATIIAPQVSRLDASNAAVLKNRFIDLISRDNYLIVLNMSQIDFVDSTGLGALLSGLKSLGNEGKLVLFGVSADVQKLFSITRLDQRVFKLASSKQEALQALDENSDE